jgi:hypothetical protein
VPDAPASTTVRAAPNRDSVVVRTAAPARGAVLEPPSLRDALPVLAAEIAPAAEGSSEEPAAGLGSTGGDEPLPPSPPRDPSESPTGLGAPSTGGGPQGSTVVFAIMLSLVMLFVPRIVRRLPKVGTLAPRIGYRLVLERPG